MKKAAYLLLLFVFALLVVPKEWLHELVHQDEEAVITHCRPAESTQVEPQHLHCQICQFHVGRYLFSTSFLLDAKRVYGPLNITADAVYKVQVLYNVASLRAPPLPA